MKLRRIWLITALLAILVGATGSTVPAAAAKLSAGAQSAAPTSKASVAAVGSANWTTYHYNNARSGYDPSIPSFSALGPGWTNSSLIGDIYAEPLVYGSTVYVVTEDNYLYALNYLTGAVLWSKHLSTPMDSSGLPCGNISPHVGITSTPVIDTSLNRIYMVGMVSTGHYVLWGVNLTTHALAVNRVVDPANLDVTGAEGQRGALGLASGLVYIPYGGRAGDCNSFGGHPYHGIVLGARRTDGHVLYRFQTNGARSGIWAAGGESIDSTAHVWVAIGNGSPPDSERVFKLNPNLSRQNSWVPYNQGALDAGDQDVGSIIPTLVGGGDVFQAGKSGDGYLLSSTAKQKQGPTDACGGLSSNASFGAAAYLAPYIYVPCANGLFVFKQTGNTFAAAWSHTGIDASPPIIAGGNVMVIDNSGDTLYVLNATTGAAVDSAAVGSVTHFATPATGNGYVFVPAVDRITAFTLAGCTSANMTPDVASPRTPGATVTFTATSTGCSGTPEYKYFVEAPGGSWTPATGYQTTPWGWNTSGLATGVYGVGVWVRAVGSSSQYESYWLGTYTLSVSTCTAASLSTVTSSPQAPGASITYTATVTACPNALFRFWLLPPGGTWTMQQDWGGNSWTWDTTGLAAGTYETGVWARQFESQNVYDAFGFDTFVLGSGSCISAGLASNVSPPQAPLAFITFTPSSNGCTTPQYEFWLLRPGGNWTVKQGFGVGSTWTWNTKGYSVGTYQVGVWVKQAGSTAAHDAYYIGTFQLAVLICTSATITPSPTSPQAPGTPVTLTATKTGCPAAQYVFWVLVPPSKTWQKVTGYTGTDHYDWDTTGRSGPFRWGVWARQTGSANSYDTYAQTTFWVGT